MTYPPLKYKIGNKVFVRYSGEYIVCEIIDIDIFDQSHPYEIICDG